MAIPPKEPLRYPVTAGSTAVICVDMQNIFCDPRDPVNEMVPSIIPNVQALLAAAREAGLPVIYLRHVVRGDGSDTGRMKDISPQVDERLKAGTWNVEIIPELTPEPGDIVVDKPFFGGFTGTDLDTILRGKGIDTVIICGTRTNICCETTARQATEREYKVIFASDANAASGKPDMGWGEVSAEENHRMALTILACNFARVASTAEILAEIRALKGLQAAS